MTWHSRRRLSPQCISGWDADEINTYYIIRRDRTMILDYVMESHPDFIVIERPFGSTTLSVVLWNAKQRSREAVVCILCTTIIWFDIFDRIKSEMKCQQYFIMALSNGFDRKWAIELSAAHTSTSCYTNIILYNILYSTVPVHS